MGARAAWLGVVLLVAALAHGGTGQAEGSVSRRLLGYYVPYDQAAWTSLQAHADALDLIGAQWVSVDGCGNLGSRDDQTLKRVAQEHGIGVVPSLFTLSGWLNHRLLTEPAVTDQFIAQIVDYTTSEDDAGFDLDLEGVDPADRDALSDLVSRTASALHAQGKLLTLAVPAKDSDVRVGWAGAYDYAALGAAADLVTVMAYEYRGPFSGPGSVAPYDWVERVLGFASQRIPPQKILLGLAFYGYDWNVTSGGARSLGYAQAVGLAERYAQALDFDAASQSATFGYTSGAEPPPLLPRLRPVTGHQVTVREPGACDALPPAPSPSPTSPPAPVPGTDQDHAVWIEDSRSAAARLALAERYGVHGAATWRLGLEDPAVWDLIAQWRASGLAD